MSARDKGQPLEPFLKWAGGKRWLVPHLKAIALARPRRVIEPFLGGGAFFFHMRPENAILSDANHWLIETYKAVKNEPTKVYENLRNHQGQHCHEYYYQVRSKKFKYQAERAAQLIYLNRTCWNALFRVNLNGQFNVPIGSKPMIVPSYSNIIEWSDALKTARLACADFTIPMAEAGFGDLVFADPPYVTAHTENGFLKYNRTIFSWEDQLRLAEASKAAAKRGALVVVTNAPHESILNLYKEFGARLHIVERSSIIAASSANRRRVKELMAVLGEKGVAQ